MGGGHPRKLQIAKGRSSTSGVGDALGKQSRASGWGLGKWQRTWGVGVCGQRPFFSHLGETLVME